MLDHCPLKQIAKISTLSPLYFTHNTNWDFNQAAPWEFGKFQPCYSFYFFLTIYPPINLSTLRANSELLQMESRMKRYVFDAPTIYGATCTGSMEIETEDGDRIIIIDTLTITRISMKSIKMHGCGCYSVYSRKYGRGAKQMMFPSQTWSKKDVGFSRIRSIFKIQC